MDRPADLFTRRLRELRGRRGLSLRDLAKEYHGSPSQLHDFEKGRKLPIRRTAEALDDALGTGGEFVAMLYPSVEVYGPAGGTTTRGQALPGAGDAGSVPWSDAADAPRSSEEPDPLDIATALARSSLPIQVVEQIELLTLAQVATYPSTPAWQMWPIVRSHLSRATRALAAPQSLRVRRRLTQVAAVLAGLAGNLAVDLGRPELAHRYFGLSRVAADEAEDRDLAAWATGLRSIEPFFAGSRRYSAELLDAAWEAARCSCGPRRRSWLAALGARAHAASGSERMARTRLDEAHAAMDGADPPYGTNFFDEDRLTGLAGSTCLALRDTSGAADLLDQALRRRPATDVKGRALLLLDLAACHVLDNEQDAAVAATHRALDQARGQLVRPILSRAREVRHGMSGSASEAARALDDRLAGLTGGTN